MADLESVLADVSYLMAMEKSKHINYSKYIKKIVLPDENVHSIMRKYLAKRNLLNFEKIFDQRLGYLLIKDFCEINHPNTHMQLRFYDNIMTFKTITTNIDRLNYGRKIYDEFIMTDLLINSHPFEEESLRRVQDAYNDANRHRCVGFDIFDGYIEEIRKNIKNTIFDSYLNSEYMIRYCQWKNYEYNLNVTKEDFSIHRIIGRGGFGEVYGCRKLDTGKMYAMKCLDKKRLKIKNGGPELALHERNILIRVSKGEVSPFIVHMTYAFQTPEKLCYVLVLMNGGDLHYHLCHHGVFSESEMRFFACELILGLHHMHSRKIVYRDLKPANILLDEAGHIRISDMGLAYDFSEKHPTSCVGTHGYMAPEVMRKNEPYNSSADWFSLGCVLFKLIKGTLPFYNRGSGMTELERIVTIPLDLPLSFSTEVRTLISGLLCPEISLRLGCYDKGIENIKSHSFFNSIDWSHVLYLKYPPPLIPPRGEVNAANAFDIGNFDSDHFKKVKLNEKDDEFYKDFNVIISERWQSDITQEIFDLINSDADKALQKKRQKLKKYGSDIECSHAILEGDLLKLSGPFQSWQKKYLKLYTNRMEFYTKNKDGMLINKSLEFIPMIDVKEVIKDFKKINKNDKCIVIVLKDETKIAITSTDKILISQWRDELIDGFRLSTEMMLKIGKKGRSRFGLQ